MRGTSFALLGGLVFAASCSSSSDQLTAAEAAQAAVAFAACRLTTVPAFTTVAERGDYAFDAETFRCALAAGNDCGKIGACLGTSQWNVDATCTPASSCSGDTFSFCITSSWGGTIAGSMDCAQRGQQCMTGPAGAACGAGTCSAGAPPQCSGSTLVSCANGIQVPHDCASDGLACDATSGVASCVGTGDACTATHCDGSTLVECLGGHEHRVDCGSIGLKDLTCESLAPSAGSAACQFANTCETQGATCNGNTLSFCFLGQSTTVDCVAAGWTSCDGALGTCR